MCSIFGAIGDISKADSAFETLSHRGVDSNKNNKKLIVSFLALIG